MKTSHRRALATIAKLSRSLVAVAVLTGVAGACSPGAHTQNEVIEANTADVECDYFSYSFCIGLPVNTSATRRDPADFVVHVIDFPEGVIGAKAVVLTIYEGNHPPLEMNDPSSDNNDFDSIGGVVSSRSITRDGRIHRAVVIESPMNLRWPQYIRVTYSSDTGEDDGNVQSLLGSLVMYSVNPNFAGYPIE